MKSVVCTLNGGPEGTAAALAEAEAFAQHAGLTEKQSLHLRLLAEEQLGMAVQLLDLRTGSFWIEQEGSLYRLTLSAQARQVGAEARNRLLGASTTGKNLLHQGISGKILQALEWVSGGPDAMMLAPVSVRQGMLPSAQSLEWSLNCYRQSLAQEEKAVAWDELEKSVLGKLADDVRVGVRMERVEIVITKTF